MQIDVKELRDIPNILDQSLALGLQKKKELPNRYGLPMYQYTARDVKSGTLFVSLAYMHNRHTAAIFADRVLTHLANHGISPRIIQTDNGTEFVNTSDATDDTPLFIQVVTRDNKTEHRRIPPGAKTWQSDVETSHWIIEREFYDVVNARSDQNFIAKLRVYQWGFNVMRKNSYKGNRTPYEIIKEEEDMKYATLPKTILDFTTCILDEKFDAFIRGGYHVSLPTRGSKCRRSVHTVDEVVVELFEFVVFLFDVLLLGLGQCLLKHFDTLEEVLEDLFVDIGDLVVAQRGLVVASFEYTRRDADGRRVRRDIFDDHGIGTDLGVLPDRNVAQDFGACADDDIVPQGRVAFAFADAYTSQCDLLVDDDIVPDDGCFADDHADAMVNKDPSPQGGRRVYVDRGEKEPDGRDETRQESQASVIE